MRIEKKFRTTSCYDIYGKKRPRPVLIGPLTRELYLITKKYKIGYWWCPLGKNWGWFRFPETWGKNGWRYFRIVILKQEFRLYMERL